MHIGYADPDAQKQHYLTVHFCLRFRRHFDRMLAIGHVYERAASSFTKDTTVERET